MPTDSASARDSSATKAPELRWYASIAGLLNVVLLLQVAHRVHHATTPINYGLARILATALAVNIAGHSRSCGSHP